MTEFDYFNYRAGVFLGKKYYALGKEMIRIDGTVQGFNQLCRKYQRQIEDIKQIEAIDEMLYQYFDLHEVLVGWQGLDYLEEQKQKEGKWIVSHDFDDMPEAMRPLGRVVVCSECGYPENRVASKYCPNCGVKMAEQMERQPKVFGYVSDFKNKENRNESEPLFDYKQLAKEAKEYLLQGD